MMDSISPYALLRASKPKPAQSAATSYDLFSQIQQSSLPPLSPAVTVSTPSQPPANPLPSAPVISTAQKRTHYIADIHMRHTAANRRAPQHTQPLS